MSNKKQKEESVEAGLELCVRQANFRRRKLDPMQEVRDTYIDAGEEVPSDQEIVRLIENGFLDGSRYQFSY